MASEQKNRIFGLDIVRCTAILLVVFSHTATFLPLSPEAKQFSLMYFGVTGVEIFFILSGYLVGMILIELVQKRSFSWATLKYFWVRRWFRTLPAYYLVIALYAAVGYYYHTGAFLAEHYKLLYLVFLQNFFTPMPDFFSPTWSLSVEEWFYLLLPLWIWGVYRFKRHGKYMLSAIVTGIVFITLLRMAIVAVYDPAWNRGVRTTVPLRLDSLLIGVGMGYLRLHYQGFWIKYAKPAFAMGIAVFLLSSVWMYREIVFTSDQAGFLTKTLFFSVFSVSIALCIPYMSLIQRPAFRVPGMIITHISLVSYSLYLLMDLVISFIPGIYYKFSIPDIPYTKFIMAWAACIVAATLMYRFWEKPFLRFRDRR